MASDARKILLVEDEKAIRDAVAAYLEREGYWVVGVGDGQSAVEEFEKHQFDLIVLDLMLPKLSGERVCRAIRDTSDVPIIMLTAKGEVEDRIMASSSAPTTTSSSRSPRVSSLLACARCSVAPIRPMSRRSRCSTSAIW